MKLKKRKSWCAQCISMPTKISKKIVGMLIRSRKSVVKDGVITVINYIYFFPHSLYLLLCILIPSDFR